MPDRSKAVPRARSAAAEGASASSSSGGEKHGFWEEKLHSLFRPSSGRDKDKDKDKAAAASAEESAPLLLPEAPSSSAPPAASASAVAEEASSSAPSSLRSRGEGLDSHSRAGGAPWPGMKLGLQLTLLLPLGEAAAAGTPPSVEADLGEVTLTTSRALWEDFMDFFDDDLEAAFDQLPKGPEAIRAMRCELEKAVDLTTRRPWWILEGIVEAIILDVIGKLTDDGGIPATLRLRVSLAGLQLVKLDTGRLLRPDGTPADSSSDHIDAAATATTTDAADGGKDGKHGGGGGGGGATLVTSEVPPATTPEMIRLALPPLSLTRDGVAEGAARPSSCAIRLGVHGSGEASLTANGLRGMGARLLASGAGARIDPRLTTDTLLQVTIHSPSLPPLRCACMPPLGCSCSCSAAPLLQARAEQEAQIRLMRRQLKNQQRDTVRVATVLARPQLAATSSSGCI